MNHTANDSEWIREHPDATYSCLTMPHLRPAFLLDVIFGWVTRDVAAGKLQYVGVPKIIENEDHIQSVRHQLHSVYLPKANLCQFYQCDTEKYVQLFSEKVRKTKMFIILNLPINNFSNVFRFDLESHQQPQVQFN